MIDTLRTSELCMLESVRGDNVALQVVVNGSIYEFFLTFRDKLIANPEIVKKYNHLKVCCKLLTSEEYRDKKSIFIETVLSGGEV
ncbi:GrpB family protein [Shewanella algae]|uniref:GrpB family protein n=1 Tax=Shewanella algae TaxID=38313 RepID=UPI001C90EE56|nr:GrpB family protein [Shewanella algae]UZD58910.1 GrpB family protein [Shewanella algae]